MRAGTRDAHRTRTEARAFARYRLNMKKVMRFRRIAKRELARRS